MPVSIIIRNKFWKAFGLLVKKNLHVVLNSFINKPTFVNTNSHFPYPTMICYKCFRIIVGSEISERFRLVPQDGSTIHLCSV